jgi:hypothetical protein
VDQRQSHEDGLLAELAASVPLADPTVVALVRELTAEISRLQSVHLERVGETSATVESLTGLLLGQAAELQELRDRLQRVRALIDLSSWAAATDGNPADPAIRASDILHAIAGPVAERPR